MPVASVTQGPPHSAPAPMTRSESLLASPTSARAVPVVSSTAKRSGRKDHAPALENNSNVARGTGSSTVQGIPSGPSLPLAIAHEVRLIRITADPGGPEPETVVTVAPLQTPGCPGGQSESAPHE